MGVILAGGGFRRSGPWVRPGGRSGGRSGPARRSVVNRPFVNRDHGHGAAIKRAEAAIPLVLNDSIVVDLIKIMFTIAILKSPWQ